MHNFLDVIEDLMFGRKVAQVTAWIMFIGGIIGWPITAITVFRDEPQGILGLSWAAIIYTAYQVLQQMHTHRLIKDTDG